MQDESNTNWDQIPKTSSDAKPIAWRSVVDSVVIHVTNTNGYPPLPTWAHSRMPIDLILSGRAISLFQASHITSMMSS